MSTIRALHLAQRQLWLRRPVSQAGELERPVSGSFRRGDEGRLVPSATVAQLSSMHFVREERRLAKLTFVATESACGLRSCSLTVHGAPIVLARESSIVRAALEALLRLEINP
jgi:hypothetical protein